MKKKIWKSCHTISWIYLLSFIFFNLISKAVQEVHFLSYTLCCCNIPLILWRNAKVCCCRWRTQKKILNYPVYHVIVNLLWPLWSSEWHYILFNANVRSLQLPSNYAVLLVSLAIKLWKYSKLYPKVICFFPNQW